jgi:ribosomal protein S18 acetylase RimI-like enzyme
MPSIRPATENDLPLIMETARAATTELRSNGVTMWDETYPAADDFRQDIQRGDLFVLESEKMIGGVIALNEEQAPEYAQLEWNYHGKIMVVHRLIVSPRCQRRGYGQQLMNLAESQALARGYDAIRLEAFIANSPSVTFYERLGYHPVGTIQLLKGSFYCYEMPASEMHPDNEIR